MFRFLSFLYLLSCLRLGAADMPEYLKAALAHFAGLPLAGLFGFDAARQRPRDRAFDPSAAMDLQWTLLEGRPQTVRGRTKKYRSYKTTFAENRALHLPGEI